MTSDPEFIPVNEMIAPAVGDTQLRYHYGRCCRLFYTEREWQNHECHRCQHNSPNDCRVALEQVKAKHPDVRVIY